MSGKRVSKSDLRINTYGTVDELNSFTGLLASMEIDRSYRETLNRIQSLLFTIGSNLALDEPDGKITLPRITAEHSEFLEREIDRMEEGLEPLTHFIIPGGDSRVASAHICRTVCRRAERLYVELGSHAELDENIGIFLNRLADYYFMLARRLMKDFDVKPVIWDPKA